MGFYAIIAFINGIVSSILGPFVYFKNRKQITNQVFALFCLTVAIWSYSYFIWQISTVPESALFWSRALMAGAIFIPIVYFHFILALIKKIKEYKRYLIFGYLIFIFFFLANFTSLFVKSVTPKLNFLFWPNPGILYHPFLLIWLLYVFFSVYLLIKELFIVTGIIRVQIKYILIGTIIGYLGGITNYFLWYDILIPPIGNWSATLYLTIVAYAIIRYRLMDIRLIFGRGIVYLLSFATIIVLAFFLMFLNNQFFPEISFMVSGSLILIISILLFQSIFRFYEKLASKYFYYTFYSYQTVLTDLGKGLTRFLDLDKLSTLIVDTLINKMKLDRTVILLREPDDGSYKIQKNIGFKEENGISLVKDNFLTFWLEKNRKSLVYEELSLMLRDTTDKEEKEKIEKLKENMKRIEANLCLPLLIGEKIIGMIVLGNKISKEPYSNQDIELLTSLANQASIALQNARLYSQVQDLSQNLQKKVEEQTSELKKAYEELKSLDEAKSEFISMASHQLRTPLSITKGYISMIIEGSYGNIPEKAKEKLKNVFYSNERLIKIVNHLLDISKIELGKIETQKEPTQIEDLVQSCYEELKIEAKKRKLNFLFEKPETPLPKIEIDQLKIRQVIMNLIDNAIKYTLSGEIKIKIEKKPSSILISIKDTGAGLTEKEKKEIFEIFTRGSAGTTYFIEGTGLGLYVAKKFLEINNGKIWAESDGKNKGSTFFIELPIE